MRNSIKKSATLSLIALLVFGCAPAPNSTKTGTDKNTPVTDTSKTVEKPAITQETTQTLSLASTDENGVLNPITPEDIEYFEVNDEKITPDQFTFDNDFSTKATKAGVSVKFSSRGSSSISIVDKNGTVLKISMKLKAGQNPVNISAIQNKLIQDLNNNIKTSSSALALNFTKDKSGNFNGLTAGIQGQNGETDTTKSVMSIDLVKNEVTIISPDGTKVVFELTKITETVNNKPEINKETAEHQKLTSALKRVDAGGKFVGNWTTTVLGTTAEVNLKLSRVGLLYGQVKVKKDKFSGQYVGNAEYNSTTQGNTVDMSLEENGSKMDFSVEVKGSNEVKLIIKDTNIGELSPLKGIPLSLKRKGTT